MTIVAGIDEAGFGPILGPLVVSATVFDVPVELQGQSMWQSLAGAVSKVPSKRKGLIAIGDSKKLYGGLKEGAAGLAHLERGVLAMLASAAHRPDSMRSLLQAVAPAVVPQAAACPWYQQLDLTVPHALEPTGLMLTANSLAARMNRVGIRMMAMHSQAILEEEYNRLVTATDNKSSTLFDIASRLLVQVWNHIPPGQQGYLVVDHQGGRVHYLEGLQRVFPGCRFKINDETESLSDYTLADGQRTLHIQFRIQAETHHLPVALASMLSKYLRELFMAMYNRYWATHLPDLAPTAGYYTDGLRFYNQILPVIQRLNVDPSRLYRCR